ncbi:enoyl-CoA hydratase/isomerase family protein [Amycolatopsis sp. CFH S0740]|uniref:enoyl-CoA hydratase/isomerase family protein n=1 Tax=Amycolatopsis sp. CFH S0740 TaxID=1644111 RepID=UPI00196A37A0|nr:enoyl-CoA hydratase-related protein [Amycolatopsis sp. CFH S0740]
MLEDRVEWDLADGLARITLNRPPANALDMATGRALREAADRVAAGAHDGTVRVVLLRAKGRTFSGGGDLREFAAAADRGQEVGALAQDLHQAILTLANTPVPVVSAIHATVAGGGIGVALAADIVLMAAEAKLQVAYTAAGLSPDCGSTWLLARRLGPARALDLALTNRALTGAEAAQHGLVSRAVPAAELDRVTDEVVAGLLAGPARAYAETKRLVAAAAQRDLATQLDDEAATITKIVATAEGIEGVNAFLEKRTPSFSQ